MIKLFKKMTGKQVMYVFLLIFFLTCNVVMELTGTEVGEVSEETVDSD